MALHLRIGLLIIALGWNRYQDANRVPTSLSVDDIATAPFRPACIHKRNYIRILKYIKVDTVRSINIQFQFNHVVNLIIVTAQKKSQT